MKFYQLFRKKKRSFWIPNEIATKEKSSSFEPGHFVPYTTYFQKYVLYSESCPTRFHFPADAFVLLHIRITHIPLPPPLPWRWTFLGMKTILAIFCFVWIIDNFFHLFIKTFEFSYNHSYTISISMLFSELWWRFQYNTRENISFYFFDFFSLSLFQGGPISCEQFSAFFNVLLTVLKFLLNFDYHYITNL